MGSPQARAVTGPRKFGDLAGVRELGRGRATLFKAETTTGTDTIPAAPLEAEVKPEGAKAAAIIHAAYLDGRELIARDGATIRIVNLSLYGPGYGTADVVQTSASARIEAKGLPIVDLYRILIAAGALEA